MLTFLLILSLAAKPNCSYDRKAELALEQGAFDQDMHGGWRVLSDRECRVEAAELLRNYRQVHSSGNQSVLRWHEGQLRAMIGQRDLAIALFEEARKPPADDQIGWNYYVEGSIAFLRGDLAGLHKARDNLANFPRPADFQPLDGAGRPIPFTWPLNLDILDGLLRCFGKPYQVAYATPACLRVDDEAIGKRNSR